LFVTEDQPEGMQAFIEKRKPDFKNKQELLGKF
jgi:1,4-dihydroxy-2-naphthoyl-CoA synthase